MGVYCCWAAGLHGSRGSVPVASDVRGGLRVVQPSAVGVLGARRWSVGKGFWEGGMLRAEMARKELRGVGSATQEESCIYSKESRVGE